MEKDEMLKSEKRKCPYCDSDKVVCTGFIENKASTLKMIPEPRIGVWLCNNCKKGFFHQEE